MNFPNGKKFAFTIIDDTDVSTVENVKPIYDLLTELGLRTTKTVWMSRGKVPNSNFARSETMEDPHYAKFVLDLQRKGFEIAFHGAAMESSIRSEIVNALEEFRSVFRHYPRVNANHALNRDNIYWGPDRFSSWPFRQAAKLRAIFGKDDEDYFQGHTQDSQYFWGDLCQNNVSYMRNFCLDTINILSVNPSMPYHDPRRPFVNRWFSAVDAPSVSSFNKTITKESVDKLESDGGVCIVATHFGKYFVRDGQVDLQSRSTFEYLAQKQGWFVSVSEILEFLASQQSTGSIGWLELFMLELRWLSYRLRVRGRDVRPKWALD